MPAVNFSQSTYIVGEDNGTVHFTLILTNPALMAITVSVTKKPGGMYYVASAYYNLVVLVYYLANNAKSSWNQDSQ